MDRNTATGLVLIFAIFFGYYVFFAPKQDTKAELKQNPKKEQTAAEAPAMAKPDEAFIKAALADSAVKGFEAKTYTLQNDEVALEINSLGGRLERVHLKKYKTYTQKPLYLFTSADNDFALTLIDKSGKKVDLRGVPFSKVEQISPQELHLSTPNPAGGDIALTYALAKEGYEVKLRAAEANLAQATFNWKQQPHLLEKDFAQSRAATTINLLTTDDAFDNLNEAKTDLQSLKPDKPVRWLALKQKFFNSGLIAPAAGIEKVEVTSVAEATDSLNLKRFTASGTFAPSALGKGAVAFTFFFGPNDYKLLSKVAPDYEKNVYLGWPVIRWVNKYIVINVFHVLQNVVSNYGLIIFLLVIFIRLLILPLGYRSYVSMAKMRVMKPELDEIKARNGDDMTAAQQEQMKLYQQVGINPLSGCFPLLLQMPILLAMFNFFPNSIELRQEHLWWAEDLSAYDSVATLPFSLPGYGDHVSLFTILMTLSTLAVTWFNNQAGAAVGPTQTLSYVMPVVFMFILNSLPAGLSFYYLVSNVVSMAQQLIIKRFVDDKKIRQRLEENKVKNATKKPGKFASRLQEALRAAEDAKKDQQKPGNNKTAKR